MSDLSERFVEAIAELDAVTGEVTPDEARAQFDEATLQTFWKAWQNLSSWNGALWRLLSEDIEAAATPSQASELHDVGGEGA